MSNYYSHLLNMDDDEVPSVEKVIANSEDSSLLSEDYIELVVESTKKLKSARDTFRPLLIQECELAKKYRDDKVYHRKFDAALKKKAIDVLPITNSSVITSAWLLTEMNQMSGHLSENELDCWPDEFDIRPLHKLHPRKFLEPCMGSLRIIAIYANNIEPYRTHVYGVAKAAELFLTAVDNVLGINILRITSGNKKLHTTGIGEIANWILLESNARCSIGRFVYEDKQLAYMVRFFEQMGDKLESCCEVILKLVDESYQIVVDESTTSVVWHGKTIEFGVTQEFTMMKLLAKKRGKWVTQQEFCDAFDASSRNSIKDVRGRLKRTLIKGGLPELDKMIQTTTGSYRLLSL